jgi:1-acyl-sn-glycerol-3-phosphate acyltransferase
VKQQRAPRDLLYRVLSRLLDVAVWRGELIGGDALPASGPAVFVANHVGSIGPIAVAASIPIRLYSWVVSDMLDSDKAAAYLCKDFVKPELHLPDRLALPVSQLLSRITVRLLRSLGCIPVWNDRQLLETYSLSDACLTAGRCLSVFPEDPQLPTDPRSGMRPFKSGFGRLGSMHFARTGGRLPFYPVAVHKAKRQVQLGEPILFKPLHPESAERKRLARLLELIISGMLVDGGELWETGVRETR